jgi:prophage DNA circulation protein
MMVVAGLGLGSVLNVSGAPSTSQLISEANKSIAVASAAVDEARSAIENGKKMVAMIPEDSPVLAEVGEMLKKAKENWVVAVSALDGARESASKISAASSPEVAQDYKLLATVNASVALSGAKVVQTSLAFVEAVAANKTEALDVIRAAMQNSLDAAEDVQQNYERVKGFIAEKYSK